nr:hypothetical protein [Desulfobacterales bacterium]
MKICDELYDQLETRCPKLGSQVRFYYCRREDDDLPCQRIFSCWEWRFPVREFIKTKLSKEDWKRHFNKPPKDRLTTLLELVEEAKRRRTKS